MTAGELVTLLAALGALATVLGKVVFDWMRAHGSGQVNAQKLVQKDLDYILRQHQTMTDALWAKQEESDAKMEAMRTEYDSKIDVLQAENHKCENANAELRWRLVGLEGKVGKLITGGISPPATS